MRCKWQLKRAVPHPPPPLQAPALRVVPGDILRLALPQLLEGMQQHWQQQQQQQQQQQAPAAGSSDKDGCQQQAGQQQAAGPAVRVVANLPYYITKDCLLRLLPLGGQLSHLFFMLQVG